MAWEWKDFRSFTARRGERGVGVMAVQPAIKIDECITSTYGVVSRYERSFAMPPRPKDPLLRQSAGGFS